MTTDSDLADTLRRSFPDYAPATLGANDAGYLESLKLPLEIEAFLRVHSPVHSVGSSSLMLSISDMREEHEDFEPGMAVRAAGSAVLATANGNPYFVVRKGDGYEIRLVDHDEVSEDDDLDALIALSGPGPVFTSFAELIDALAAQVLPSSPYAKDEIAAFETWRAARG